MAEYAPQIDYTSRDYYAIRADLLSNIQRFAPQWTSRDPNDLGIVLLELFAYMGDIMSFYIDRAANESFLSTATQRSSIISLANMFGYTPNMGISASADLTFKNNHATDTIRIMPGLTVSTSTASDSAATQLEFETMNTSYVDVAAGGTAVISAREGRTVSYEELSYSFNGLPNQVFKLAEKKIELYTMGVYVDDVPYLRVENLIDSDGSAAVYTSFVDSDGNTYVAFGDNIGGRIPPKGSIVSTTYRVVNGAAGNVAANSINYITSTYTKPDGSDASGLTVTNASAAAGGTDPESTTSVRINTPRSMRAINRAVTAEDYAGLASQVVGVGKTSADASVYSNIILYMSLAGSSGLDGAGSPLSIWDTYQTDVENYLANKVAPGASVTVLPPTMVPVDIEVTIQVNGTYSQSTVKTATENSIKDLLAYDNVSFGQMVSQQDLALAIGLTNGVLYSSIQNLYVHGSPAGIGDIQCAIGEIPYLNTITVHANGGIV